MANEVQRFIRNDSIQARINQLLDKRASQFTTSLLSVVNNNGLIAQCKPETVLNAALTAASLDLPINQNLGFAFIIPYKNKGVYEAQFQLGTRGLIQLAQRSGQYKTIAATAVYNGQLVDENPLTGNTYNWKAKESDDVVGYVSMFKLVNGFEKELYMTLDEIMAHGKRYSQSFKSGFGPWADNFEAMAEKTVLKRLISKYGPQSVEMQQAIVSDQSVDDGQRKRYVDNDLDDVGADDDTKAAIIAANGGEATEDLDDLEAEGGSAIANTEEPIEPATPSAVPGNNLNGDDPKPKDAKPEPPKKSVKEKAAEFVEKGKASNAAKRGEQASLVDDNTSQ